MKLILKNGYPFPPQEDFEKRNPAYNCEDYTLKIEGVRDFDWTDRLIVEFISNAAAQKAMLLTNWIPYDTPRVLGADVSRPGEYDNPAIVVRGMAYCGFTLVETK